MVKLIFPDTPAFRAAAVEYLTAPDEPLADSWVGLDARRAVIIRQSTPETLADNVARAEVKLGISPDGVDSSGRPWDYRIDSSNQKKNQDGTWQARRGVTPIERARIIGEIMAPQAGTSLFDDVPAPIIPPPPPAAAPLAPPPPPVVAPAREWNVGTLIGAAATAGRIAELTEAAKLQGVENIGLLHQRPDLFASLAAAVGL